MKKVFLSSVMLAVMAVSVPATANAIDIKDIIGGAGGTVGNLIEGVFTKTNLEVSDMVGEWTIDGSAVTFKSDNLLKKAGGAAAAAAIEAKLDPYYKQYGLTGGVVTINNDSTFKLTVKKMTLSGTISKKSDGTFAFKFKALGKVTLGSVTTYVQKSGSTLELMFDASKLKSIVSSVACMTGNSLAKSVGSILDGYDGLCVGFSTTKSGDGDKSATVNGTSKSAPSDRQGDSKSGSAVDEAKSKATEALKGLFGK